MSNPQNLTSQKDHFFQFLSEIKKYTPSNTSSESFFLDNLRFNFPFTVLPNFEEIENIFSLVNDSRYFYFILFKKLIVSQIFP